MAKVVLIPNPNPRRKTGGVGQGAYVPLGLLGVAHTLRAAGHHVEILDINQSGNNLSPDHIRDDILGRNPDIVGFSTMCNQYLTTIKMAYACKLANPHVKIMFGGPQATITDRPTLEAFPFVDVIVRGECERTIGEIVAALAVGHGLENLPGVSFRKDGRVIQTPLPELANLDDLPFPDYGLYSQLDAQEFLPVETGRGCPYECSFCSTSDFWRRRWRMRSTANQLAVIKELNAKYGFRKFKFEHDNLTAARKNVLELCDAINREGLDITWGCSARIDCLDRELIDRMVEAGCDRIYFGIETGSPRMQQVIKKRLDLTHAVETAGWISHAGMRFTASFIMGFPEEEMEDLLQTVDLMARLKFAGKGDDVVQLHLLAPEPGTALYNAYRTNLRFDGYLSDVADADLSEEDYANIKRHPDIFSAFHYYDIPGIGRETLVRFHYFLVNLLFLPYTLYVLWSDRRFGFPNRFLGELSRLELPPRAWLLQHGYENIERVASFISDVLSRQSFAEHFIHEVIRYELKATEVALRDSPDIVASVEQFTYDVEGIIDKIRNKELTKPPDHLRENRHRILFVRRGSQVNTVRVASHLT